jgi:S-adenosylmethionine synthetase
VTKSLKERAEAATKEVQEILGVSAESHPKEIADAVERTIIDALLEERQRCATVASKCCGDDREKGQLIAEEINRTNAALIANLSSMR